MDCTCTLPFIFAWIVLQPQQRLHHYDEGEQDDNHCTGHNNDDSRNQDTACARLPSQPARAPSSKTPTTTPRVPKTIISSQCHLWQQTFSTTLYAVEVPLPGPLRAAAPMPSKRGGCRPRESAGNLDTWHRTILQEVDARKGITSPSELRLRIRVPVYALVKHRFVRYRFAARCG